MINLIKTYIHRSRKDNHWFKKDISGLPYHKIHDQVFNFLADTKASKHHRRWLRALVAVLNREMKTHLVNDLLTAANKLPEVPDDSLLIDVAMEIIYPPTVLKRIRTEVKNKSEEGNHYYISLNHLSFARIVVYWRKEVSGDINFFDVGCGLGDKLVLANWFIDGIKSVTGIEINQHSYHLGKFFIGDLYDDHGYNMGRRLSNKNPFPIPLEIIEGDAFDMDYKPYNMVYLYQPIANVRKLHKLYLHILETMPVGGLMIEVCPYHCQGTQDMIETLCERKDLSVLDRDHCLVVKKIA